MTKQKKIVVLPVGRNSYYFARIPVWSVHGNPKLCELMYGDEARFEEFLYLGCYVGVLEMVLESLRVLLHLLEDTAHGGVAEDGLYFWVGHCAFADLGIRAC